MIATLVATTPKISMQPLAFQGIMVYESFPQIRDMLLRRFGDDYVLLFTRPEENRGDGNIDWYSPVQGEAMPLNGLPEAERAPVCANIARIANDIRNYAEELIQSREPLKITRGNILKLALRYPDDSALYVIGKQPVVTCWGFAPGTPGVEGTDLVRLAAPRSSKAAPRPASHEPAPGPAAAPVASRKGWNRWWLLPLLPLILIFLLLFCSFGSITALSGYTLFHVPGLPFLEKDRAASSQIAALEAETDDLRAQVEKHAALCAPPKASAEPKPQASAEPKPPLPAPEKGERLVIPEKAQNVEFMQGSWRCATGLANKRTGEPVELIFHFDRDGRGKGVTYERNDQCEGNARAEMRGGKLHIELAEQTCRSNQARYTPVVIDCDSATDGSTHCRGVNLGYNTTWEARFFKE